MTTNPIENGKNTTETGNTDKLKPDTSETVKTDFSGRKSSSQQIRILSNEPSAIAQKQTNDITNKRGDISLNT